MELRRKIRLFFATYGKLLFQIIGVIALIIFVIQTANQYVILSNKEKEQKNIQYQKEREKEKEIIEAKEYIITFINYCNEQNIEEAYKMLSENCKNEKYPTIENFKEKYVKKIFNYKKQYEVTNQDSYYKVIFLEDALQSGSIENRKQIEDYYSVNEDVLGDKSININLYNNI